MAKLLRGLCYDCRRDVALIEHRGVRFGGGRYSYYVPRAHRLFNGEPCPSYAAVEPGGSSKLEVEKP